jgi:hypothetical protein
MAVETKRALGNAPVLTQVDVDGDVRGRRLRRIEAQQAGELREASVHGDAHLRVAERDAALVGQHAVEFRRLGGRRQQAGQQQ